MEIVRPAGVSSAGGGVVGVLGGVVVLEAPEVVEPLLDVAAGVLAVLELAAGRSSPPLQAVTDSDRASTAAYRKGWEAGSFVTPRSLDSAI
jgi:hypothetical protein